MTKQQQFASKIDELIKLTRSLPPKARAEILDALNEARKQIVAEISSLNPDSFTYAQRQALKSSIDRVMKQFGQEMTTTVNDYQADAAKAGTVLVDGAVNSGFGNAALGQVDANALAIAQGYTADLITGLSSKAAADVNAALGRAFLGGQSLSDIIAQVSKALGSDSPTADRAITITNNEILRMQSIATQARMEALADQHPALKKEWMHIPASRVPRIGHIDADGQIVAVDQPFIVEDEELMYPRDPNGSPENTINCHCLSRPYIAPEDLTPTADDKGLLDSLGISVKVKRAA